MENFGFGHLNIKKAYVLKSLEQKFFHNLDHFLGSTKYEMIANNYAD